MLISNRNLVEISLYNMKKVIDNETGKLAGEGNLPILSELGNAFPGASGYNSNNSSL